LAEGSRRERLIGRETAGKKAVVTLERKRVQIEREDTE